MANTFICAYCNQKEDPAHWLNGADLAKRQTCLNCAYWLDLIPASPEAIIIAGNYYTLGPEDEPENRKGFAGFSFTIERTDGGIVHTTNLNHCGQIPSHFKDRLPDNARLIDGGWVSNGK